MPQINKPTDYFNTKLYTGTSASNSITVGFQPDWVWLKERPSVASHGLFDSVRGTGKYLRSDLTNAEVSIQSTLSSFDANGFTLGTNTVWNNNNDSYVAWNWLAGGTASSNTDGSITSSVSASTTSGFSIVSYTGSGSSPSTVGHGLGEVPKMIILKNRDSGSAGWQVYFHTLGNANKLELQSTNGSAATSNWNSTSPTSSVFTINGTASGAPDASGENIIAYCFAEKKGFSKFGSYTGNGSTDGTFVYTGFKPAWVMFKETTDGTAGDNWFIYDNKRSEFNQTQKNLRANLSAAEADSSAVAIDILSNGYKLRTNDDSLNGSGDSYIYMAFAESPLVGTNNIPACAR